MIILELKESVSGTCDDFDALFGREHGQIEEGAADDTRRDQPEIGDGGRASSCVSRAQLDETQQHRGAYDDDQLHHA